MLYLDSKGKDGSLESRASGSKIVYAKGETFGFEMHNLDFLIV